MRKDMIKEWMWKRKGEREGKEHCLVLALLCRRPCLSAVDMTPSLHQIVARLDTCMHKYVTLYSKEAITSKIKHAIKLKSCKTCITVAQLLQLSLAFCFSLQPMTAYRPVLDGWYAVTGCKLKQNANEGRNSCASLAALVLCFIACFILLVIAP